MNTKKFIQQECARLQETKVVIQYVQIYTCVQYLRRKQLILITKEKLRHAIYAIEFVYCSQCHALHRREDYYSFMTYGRKKFL